MRVDQIQCQGSGRRAAVSAERAVLFIRRALTCTEEVNHIINWAEETTLARETVLNCCAALNFISNHWGRTESVEL